jgi:hypothetical protein
VTGAIHESPAKKGRRRQTFSIMPIKNCVNTQKVEVIAFDPLRFRAHINFKSLKGEIGRTMKSADSVNGRLMIHVTCPSWKRSPPYSQKVESSAM